MAVAELTILCLRWPSSSRKARKLFISRRIHPFPSMDDKNDFYNQLGFFSLKKKIEDAVLRTEMVTPRALEVEEARRIQQEAMIRECNLWDDPVKSSEILMNLVDSSKAVDALKDLKYKAEEAKLISELAEMEAINYHLFKQAYSASLDMSKFLDQYEMSKLLKGPYDMEGACLIITAGSRGSNPEVWAEELLWMYSKWAEKLGYRGRLVEKHPSVSGGMRSATIEFEFEYAYGYLSGERGIHCLISSENGSIHNEDCWAHVDVAPVFLGTAFDVKLKEEDLAISESPVIREERSLKKQTVCIKHIPTGITVQSSGERSHFANKLKALNRLKAKLLVVASEQKVSKVSSINGDAILDFSEEEVRRYMLHPYKLVHDVKTSIRLSDLNSVLGGNIEPLIAAHISMRHLD